MVSHLCAEEMVRRYDINHAAKCAGFNASGNIIISCSDFDLQVGTGWGSLSV